MRGGGAEIADIDNGPPRELRPWKRRPGKRWPVVMNSSSRRVGNPGHHWTPCSGYRWAALMAYAAGALANAGPARPALEVSVGRAWASRTDPTTLICLAIVAEPMSPSALSALHRGQVR